MKWCLFVKIIVNVVTHLLYERRYQMGGRWLMFTLFNFYKSCPPFSSIRFNTFYCDTLKMPY